MLHCPLPHTEVDQPQPLADRSPYEPHPDRLPLDRPDREAILRAHQSALDLGQPGYLDPTSGLFVMTAALLKERGRCCATGCRHCPWAR